MRFPSTRSTHGSQGRVDAEFGDAFADWLDVTRVAEGKSTNPDVDAGLGLSILESRRPSSVGGCLADLDHGHSVSHGIRQATA